MIGCDSEGAITYWSPAAARIYGFSAEEALGARPRELLRTRFPAPLLEILEELADVGSWQGRLVHRTRDGRAISVESRWVAPDGGDGGGPRGAVAIERVQPDDAGEAAAQAPPPSAMATAPAADGSDGRTLAHDLNNALAIIINYTAFVAEGLERLRAAPTDDQRAAMRRDLREVTKATERAISLTRQWLDPPES